MTEKKRVNKKKLKLSAVEAKVLKMNEMSEYIFNQETMEVIKYYEVFPEDKIDELIEEIGLAMDYVQENEVDFLKKDSEFMKYVQYLIVKKFTHFDSEIGTDFQTNIDAMEALYVSGLYTLILDVLLRPDQVHKVIDKVVKVTDNVGLVLEEQARIKKELDSKVQNKDVLLKGNVDG